MEEASPMGRGFFLFALAFVFVSVAVFSGSARGDQVLNLDVLINGSPPSTTPPWMTLDFHTVSAGDVNLTVANNMSSSEFSDTVLFNTDSGIDPTTLSYTYLSGNTDLEIRASFDRQDGATRPVVDPRVSFRSAFLKVFRPLSRSTEEPSRHGPASSFRSSGGVPLPD
jgi:hypothetical protein